MLQSAFRGRSYHATSFAQRGDGAACSGLFLAISHELIQLIPTTSQASDSEIQHLLASVISCLFLYEKNIDSIFALGINAPNHCHLEALRFPEIF